MDDKQELQRIKAELIEAKAAVKFAEDFFTAATDLESRRTWQAIILARSTAVQHLTKQQTTLVEQLAATGSSTTMEDVVKETLRQQEEVAERRSLKTIRLVGSKASSSIVREASKRLRVHFDHAHALTPAFKQRMGPVAEATTYKWFADEDNKAQVDSVRQHLQEHYAPPGVKVIAVTGDRWLEAVFEEEQVVIVDTHTDFVFLAAEAVELYELMAGAIGSDRMRSVLPGILGLYETKTSEGLFSNLSMKQVQAKIEYLAVNRMTEDSGMSLKPIVVLGDLNHHYIFQKVDSKVTMTATKPSDLAYAIQHIKNLLLLRAQEAHLVLPSTFAPPDEGNDAGGEESGGLDQLQPDAASDPQNPSGAGGSGTGTPLHGAAAMDSQSTGHRTSDQADRTPMASCASQPPAPGSRGDDDGDEAMREAAFSQDVVHLVRTAPVFESLGLPCAPTTIRHMNLDEWLASKKFLA